MDAEYYPLEEFVDEIKSNIEVVASALGMDLNISQKLDRSRLETWSKTKLTRYLNTLGYKGTSRSTKEQLVEQILSVEAPDTFKACISSFLLKPLPDLMPLRMGQANEDVTLHLLGHFVESKGVVEEVLTFTKVGLLHEINNKHQADSPDALILYKPKDRRGNILFSKFGAAVVEIKSNTTEKSVAQEVKLAKKFGRVVTIVLPQDKEKFRQCVPNITHRMQLLVHTCGKKLEVW